MILHKPTDPQEAEKREGGDNGAIGKNEDRKVTTDDAAKPALFPSDGFVYSLELTPGTVCRLSHTHNTA